MPGLIRSVSRVRSPLERFSDRVSVRTFVRGWKSFWLEVAVLQSTRTPTRERYVCVCEGGGPSPPLLPVDTLYVGPTRKAIQRSAAGTLKRITLELGGNAWCTLFDRILHSRSAIEFHTFVALEVLPSV
jgi:hypothetical protein